MSNVDSVHTPALEPERERAKSHAGRKHPLAGRIRGPAVEAVLGIAAMVLAVFGLAGFLELTLAALAMVAAGAALLFEGAAVAAKGHAHRGGGHERELVGGFGAEALTGLGAVTLGILALVGIEPLTLLSVAAIVLGAGMLLAGAATVREEASDTSEPAHRAVLAASGLHTLIGAGSIVLGILGVLGNAPVVLSLVAALAVGAGLLASGAALAGRLVALFERPA